MKGAGRLKTRLALEMPVDMPDGQGGVVRSYAAQANVWVALTPLAGRDDVEADAAGAEMRFRIILRNEFGLTLQHRFKDGDRLYRIVTFREVEDGRFVEIEAASRLS